VLQPVRTACVYICSLSSQNGTKVLPLHGLQQRLVSTDSAESSAGSQQVRAASQLAPARTGKSTVDTYDSYC
jgi:hypothetical protein